MANTVDQTKTQSEQTQTNQQVGAGTGGAAIGANSSNNRISVINNNSDLQVFDAAGKAITDTTAAALANSTQVSINAQNTARDVAQNSVSSVVQLAGSFGSALQSAFSQFTGATEQATTESLTVQNNATTAALNVIANAAPQTQAALKEHLAGSAVIPAGQDITGAEITSHISVTEILVIAAIGFAAYVFFHRAASI
jgi:hypothetical protein